MTKESLTKFCNDCGNEKVIIEFRRNRARSSGYASECIKCARIRYNRYIRTKDGLISEMYKNQKVNSKKRCHISPQYSKTELTEWLNKQIDFDCIYLNWINSGYETFKKPSVDRKDDNIGYCISNIRLVSFGNNLLKSCNQIKSGEKKHCSKPVIQLSMDGKVINKFHSLMQANRETGVNFSYISACCRGKLTKTQGFMWKFA